LRRPLTSRDQINQQLRGRAGRRNRPLGHPGGAGGTEGDRPATVHSGLDGEADARRPGEEARHDPQRRQASGNPPSRPAQGQKQAQILAAEGAKQAAILNAEGERQSRILRAQGERAARYLQAQGQAKAIGEGVRRDQGRPPHPGRCWPTSTCRRLPQMAQGDANKVWLVPSDYGKALEGFAKMLGAPGDDGVFRYEPPKYEAPAAITEGRRRNGVLVRHLHRPEGRRRRGRRGSRGAPGGPQPAQPALARRPPPGRPARRGRDDRSAADRAAGPRRPAWSRTTDRRSSPKADSVYTAVGGRSSAHGRCRSRARETASTVASSCGRPITWTASGSPSPVWAGGDGRGRVPAQVPQCRERREPLCRQQHREPPVPGQFPDLKRRPVASRGEQHVHVVEHPVHLRRHGCRCASSRR